MSNTDTAYRVAHICREVAYSVHGERPPTVRYAEQAARLLFMTAAHESDDWQARRQYGFGAHSTAGAFGLFQCEVGSITDSLQWLGRRSEVRHRVRGVLAFYSLDQELIEYRHLSRLLRAIQEPEGDVLSCILARCHYFRVPQAIPRRVGSQAAYAKRYYNTHLGAASPQDYEDAFRSWWPLVGADEVVAG